jgi:FkbM family methyltransferase
MSLFEKYNLPGAWRVRTWFEEQTYKSPSNRVVCSTEHGFRIVLEPFNENGVEKSIFQTGTYERGTLAIINSVLKEGERFVDVGANVGLMSLLAAKRVGPLGRVDAFEPLPEIRDLLYKSIEINNFHNIHVHEHALGSSLGTMNIFRHPEVNRGSASLAWGNTEDLKTEIAIDTLDHSLSQSSAQTVSMIKIDVEGWELEVIKGGQETFTRDPKPIACIEFSRSRPLHGGSLEEMFQLVQAFGYSGYILDKSKSTISRLKQIDISSIPDHDNVFFIPTNRINELDKNIFIQL